MINAKDIVGKVPYYGEREVLINDDDQNVNEIINAVIECHEDDKTDYDSISDQFWKNNAKDTGKFLFDFLKKNVTYDIEPESDQTVKTPGVILTQRYGDCKHYALWICGICDSLNRKGYPIEAKYRFVSDYPDRDVHHVFAVIKGKDGEYWCDPVINRFDQRPTFYNIKDATMAISKLSGTGGVGATLPGRDIAIVAGLNYMEKSNNPAMIENYLGRHGHRVTDFDNVDDLQKCLIICLKKDVEPYYNDTSIGKKNKAKHKGHKNFLKGIAHGFEVNAKNLAHGIKVDAENAKTLGLKVSLAAARGPFLSLVDINLFNMAKHLRDAVTGSDRNALLSEWKKIGGNPRALINAINNGYREYKKHAGHGGWNQARDRVNGISGSISGPEIAAWLALAGSVIAILAKFIKFSPKEQQQLAAGVANGAGAIASAATAADSLSDLQDAADNGDPTAIAQLASMQPGGPGGPLPPATNPDGSSTGMSMATGVDQDGNPVMAISSVDPSSVQNAGMATDANSDPDAVPGGGDVEPETGGDSITDNPPPGADVAPIDNGAPGTPSGPGAFDIAFGKISAFVSQHKGPIALVSLGALGVAAMSKKKKKRR